MRQEKLDCLYLLMIEADLLHKINFDDIIKDLVRHRYGKKELLNVNVCFLLSMKDKVQ